MKNPKKLMEAAELLTCHPMTKSDAMEMLGCKNELGLANRLRVSHTTVGRWSEVLPLHAVLRVVQVLPSAG